MKLHAYLYFQLTNFFKMPPLESWADVKASLVVFLIFALQATTFFGCFGILIRRDIFDPIDSPAKAIIIAVVLGGIHEIIIRRGSKKHTSEFKEMNTSRKTKYNIVLVCIIAATLIAFWSVQYITIQMRATGGFQ